MTKISVPTYDQMMNPALNALVKLGGSGTVSEILDVASDILELSDQQREVLHSPGKSSQSEVAYRLAWTRTYLKKCGLLDNSSRGVWALTPEGLSTQEVDPETVKRFVVRKDREEREQKKAALDEYLDEENASSETVQDWQDELSSVLFEMDSSAFERLCQRMLRESGFTQVDVTGRSGDGGIDGIGVMRLGGFLSFRVLFQCKRYKGSVGAGTVRDFRGAMIGRTDKGLIVTTGNFTRDAIREATRDGAPEIDLIDGEQLIDKLKELGLGVTTEEVVTEQMTVNPDFFANI